MNGFHTPTAGELHHAASSKLACLWYKLNRAELSGRSGSRYGFSLTRLVFEVQHLVL